MDDKAEGAWNPMGHLDTATADRISGWAALKGRADPVTVELYLGGRKCAERLATDERPDVRVAASVNCGFSFRYPLAGLIQPVRVYAKIKDATEFLPGSGRFLQPADGLLLRSTSGEYFQDENTATGEIRIATAGERAYVSGWARLHGTPDPARVEIFLDDQKIAECTAGSQHSDEMPPFVGENFAGLGFSSEINLSDAGFNSRVFARVLGCRTLLSGSGSFVFPPTGNKLLFLHINKTGGSTLNSIAQTFYHRSLDHIEYYNELNDSAAEGFNYISGHIQMAKACKYRKAGFVLFTILREPVGRFLSFLNQERARGDLSIEAAQVEPSAQRICQALFAAERSLPDQIECLRLLRSQNKSVDALYDNVITRYLASVPYDQRVSREHLHRAKAALASLDGVGFLEYFAQSLKLLNQLTGHPWQDHSEAWENKGAGTRQSAHTSEEERLLDEFIWADREVYWMALENFLRSGIRCGGSGGKELGVAGDLSGMAPPPPKADF